MKTIRTVNHQCTGTELAAAVAASLASDMKSALDRREKIVFLASGGRSPGPILSELSQANLDWARVTVSLTDDRRVPPDHPHSNARLVREALLRGPAAKASWVPLWEPEDGEPSAALRRLDSTLGAIAPFDVALLGMGMDGHTASIFPGGKGMAEARTSTHLFAETSPAPVPPEAPWPRITATMSTLANTPALHLLLFGADKMALFERITSNPEATEPMATLVAAASQQLTVHTTP